MMPPAAELDIELPRDRLEMIIKGPQAGYWYHQDERTS